MKQHEEAILMQIKIVEEQKEKKKRHRWGSIRSSLFGESHEEMQLYSYYLKHHKL